MVHKKTPTLATEIEIRALEHMVTFYHCLLEDSYNGEDSYIESRISSLNSQHATLLIKLEDLKERAVSTSL